MSIEHMLSKEAAAARAGTSIGTINRSDIPKYRVGKRVLLHPDDVDALAASLRRTVTAWPSAAAAT